MSGDYLLLDGRAGWRPDGPGTDVIADRDGVRPRPGSAAAQFSAGPLDSGITGCEWHRILVHATVPEGSALTVATRTTDAGDDWTGPDPAGDSLVHSPPGRLLRLRLTLTGAPVVHAIRVYYPRATSLRHLPAIYAQQPAARDFLARFLAIFDTVRDSVAARLDDFPALLDPMATPAAFLDWLGGWLGLAGDRRIPEPRRRALLAEAHHLFHLRGTVAGVTRQVELTTGVRPRILEHFRLRRWLHEGERLGGELWGPAIAGRLQIGEHSRIGDFRLVDTGEPDLDPFAVLAHRFTVYVPARADRDLVRQAVDAASPAHTDADIRLVAPRMRVGVQATVGLDTVIAARPAGITLDAPDARAGRLLGPSADELKRPSMVVGLRATIGATTRID
jgi:phage tail-like protein